MKGGWNDATVRARPFALVGAILVACGSDERLAPLDPRFATKVVSFSRGGCGGFGESKLPDVVLGPPEGAGTRSGGFDVVSLGHRGEIVVSTEPNAIVDGEGIDLLVFENPFFAGGDETKPNAELGEVAVSDDGITWTAFPCATAAFPYEGCAGVHPVLASKDNGVSPLDPAVAGGDGFDLGSIGVAHARFVRVRDLGTTSCEAGSSFTNGGFDLDAVAVVHGER